MPTSCKRVSVLARYSETFRSWVLEAICIGHQGDTKYLLLARESVFWPGITNGIKQLVIDCDICNKYQAEQPKLPVMQPDLPTRHGKS